MKKILIVLILLFHSLLICAQDNGSNQEISVNDYSPKKIRTLDTLIVNVNDLTSTANLIVGTTYNINLNILNGFNIKAFISNIEPNCFCVAPSWLKNPLQPGVGQSVEIKITPGIEGAMSTAMKIFFASSETPVMLGYKVVVLNYNSIN